jgi:hypothetical protein
VQYLYNKSHWFYLAEAVSALNANISDSMALHRDYIMAHDAAVTALEQIYLFHKDRINASEVHCYSCFLYFVYLSSFEFGLEVQNSDFILQFKQSS